MDGIIEDVGKYVKTYTDKCLDKNSREKSYDYVHRAFVRYIREVRGSITNTEDKKKEIDLLALSLYAFLGSWGMLRGSSFLLCRNHTCLRGVCSIICETHSIAMNGNTETVDYTWLLDVSPFSDHFDKNKYVRDVCWLAREIVCYFDTHGLRHVPPSLSEYVDARIKEKEVCTGRDIEVTPTLVSKIMLATLGCIPAYDTFVIEGLRSLNYVAGISVRGLNEKSGLLGFVYNHESALNSVKEMYDVIRKQNEDETEYVEYSYMKYVDMILWEYGFLCLSTII